MSNFFVKVVKWLIIVTICLYLSYVVFILFFFFDNSHYKQIGDTHFYLSPNGTGQESRLFHDGGERGIFYPINHEGLVHDVYWNQLYLIVKCSQGKEENWYIIRNIEDYNYPKFRIRHLLNENDYQGALDSLGISEECMEHIAGTNLRSPHLYKNRERYIF